MDVTQAASGTPAGLPDAAADPVFMAGAAKILAALNAGAEDVAALTDATGLETDQILEVLAWLSKAGMVMLDHEGATVRARLTDSTKAALSSK
jgi:hypothetical protein